MIQSCHMDTRKVYASFQTSSFYTLTSDECACYPFVSRDVDNLL